jgi:hypothetical protein
MGVLACVVGLAACEPGDKAAAPTTTTSSLVDAGPVSRWAWDGARTGSDGRELVIFLTGGPELVTGNPCTEAYDARVAESSTAVRVRLLARRPATPADWTYGCTSAGHTRSVKVRLKQPLGKRGLVQEPEGGLRPVFDGATLLEPSWLPDGYRFWQEQPGFGEFDERRDWRRVWGSDRAADGQRCVAGRQSISVAQSPAERGAGSGSAPSPGAQERDVRGNKGWYLPPDQFTSGGVVWNEDGTSIVVRSEPACEGDTPVPEDALLRFARGLQAP